MRVHRRSRRAAEDGAAAVEFALISMPLMLMLFGILQFGLLFNDSLQVRQAARDGARAGAVGVEPAFCTPVPASTGSYAQRLASCTRLDASPVTGPTAVRVSAPSGWKRSMPLTVCVITKSAATGIGVVPMPNGGFVLSRTQMLVENDMTTPGTLPDYSSDFTEAKNGGLAASADPSGSGWSWCG